MKQNQHITPHPDGGWQVKKGGAQRATKITSTQREAIEIAREIAIIQECETVIHGRNGQIREKNSYGNDPSNTPG